MKQESNGLNVNIKTFITSMMVIFALMVFSYILTFIIPSGEYVRYINDSGHTMINLDVGYHECEGGISFLNFILSPFLVLGSENGTLIAVIIFFLLIIGGTFNALEKCNLMKYMLDKITAKYIGSRYRLITLITLFFMTMGGFVGSFEECIPLVPLCVSLAISLGFDVYTGLGISLLAVGCGFSSGVCNAFTVGIAQQIAGLPIFSGISLRLASFVLIYVLLMVFILLHAKKVAHDVDTKSYTYIEDDRMEKGSRMFIVTMAIGITVVLSSSLLTFLQDYTLVIIAVTFLVAGIGAPLLSGMKVKELVKNILEGAGMMLPAALMILMASSIRYILEEAKVLDTVLYYLICVSSHLDKWVLVIFIYLIVQIMDFFVSSGSAKAFMLMPLIIPIAQVFGISEQLCVLAYAFGDGFSNVFFPTNAGLLISLSMSDLSYGKWVKWAGPFMFINLLLTAGILLLGLRIGY